MCNNIYNPKGGKRQSTPVPEEDDILQDISVNDFSLDIRAFNPNDPIHSVAPTSNVHQETSPLTPVSEQHLDLTNPAQFHINFSFLPAASPIACTTATSTPHTMPSTPHPAHQQQQTEQLIQQQGQGAHHLQQGQGAHHLQQPIDTGGHQAVTNQNPDSIVSASTSDLKTPTDASGASIISANT